MNTTRLALILISVVVIPACGGGSGGGPPSTGGSGVVFSDPGIETFPNEGNTHVAVGTVIVYHTDPPTSGDHYPDPQLGGFYTKPVDPGYLVHSLEHGGVVIYLDSAHVAAGDVNKLKKLAADHPGDFAQVVVVPRDDATYPVILTAWTHRLRLQAFDETRLNEFLALFLGNGPEHDE